MKPKKEYKIRQCKLFCHLYELYKNGVVVKGQYGNMVDSITAGETQINFIKQYLEQFRPEFNANKDYLTRQEINKAILRGIKQSVGGKNEN
jgi:hypothetical protein